MNIDIVARPDMPHQVVAAQAFAEGVGRHGYDWSIVARGEEATTDIVVCWGWRVGEKLAARGACVLVMEAGYVGNRMQWISLGWNGLNGRAQFPICKDAGARWNKYFGDVLKPARHKCGSYTLVLGQVRGDAALAGLDIEHWYDHVRRRCREPILFRLHPVESDRYGQPKTGLLYGMRIISGDLDAALSGAACAVAYNSNALTSAALAGVPVIACDPGAMAWPVAAHGLDAVPALGDREAWAHRLAWCQWSLEEMRSGEAWEAVSGEVGLWS